MSRGTRLNILLLLLLLIITAVIALQWLNPPRLESRPLDTAAFQVPEDVGSEKTVDYFKVVAQDNYGEIIDRPLFLATRRPPEPEPVEKVAVQEPEKEVELNVTLIGVMVMPETTTVLLRNDDDGKVKALKQGDSLERWQLETIQSELVVLRKGEKTKELRLIRNKRKPKISKKEQKNKQLKERLEKIKQRRLAAQQKRAELEGNEEQEELEEEEEQSDGESTLDNKQGNPKPSE